MRPSRSAGTVCGAALLALVGSAGPLSPCAWGQGIGQGYELERAGQPAQAASLYFAVLRAEPANVSALLGLERVLPGLSRLAELLPLAQRAAAASPTSATLRGVLLRTYAGLNAPDSARAVALRWAGAAPRDEAPYREWAIALEDAHNHAAARDVFLLGRGALGRSDAFAIELAELDERSGDWEGAAREWVAALVTAPGQLPNATSELAETPRALRPRVARLLSTGDLAPPSRRLAGELLLTWGQPREAWAVFAPSVAPPAPDAAEALRRFADLAAAQTTPDARRVRALALARFADLAPETLAAPARADAVRAFIEAGDREGARHALEEIARDSGAPADAQARAQSAVIEALIDEGQLAEAATRLDTDPRLAADDRAALRRKLVRAQLTAGDIARAEATLGSDSSVDALALRGWLALYRGRLAETQQWFRAAGPYAGTRREATERTSMLALLQHIPADTVPPLGGALLLLARGDSNGAVAALRHAADDLGTGSAGRPDVLLLAGRVAARLGAAQQATALALFDEVVRTGGTGAAAPAAELQWARLLLAQQQRAAAIQHLEHLLLTYPGSAVVPETRRELERAKGAIPQS